MEHDFVHLDEHSLNLMSEIELRNLAGEIGLPLDDNPSIEILRMRFRRAAY